MADLPTSPSGTARSGDAPTQPGEAPAPAGDPKSSAGTRENERRGPALGDPDRAWLGRWCEEYGYANSGVRIEVCADDIAAAITADVAVRMRMLAYVGNPLAATELLLEAARPRLGVNSRRQLERLVAVLRLCDRGLALEERRPPAYRPAPGRAFYLVHMRDPYETNGYVTRTHFVLQAITKAGFEPEPITRLGFPNDLARHRHVSVDPVAEVGEHAFRSLKDDGGGLLWRPIDDYVNAYADRIVALAMKRRPALIHAASNYLNGLAGIVAARRLGIPCVYEVRGVWEITQASVNAGYEGSLRYRLQRTLENQTVRNADRVVAISEPLRRFVIENGARETRVVVLPNGVDSEALRPRPQDRSLRQALRIPEDSVVIGYVGSIVRYEGLDFVLETLARLRQAGVGGHHFVVVGDGAALAELTHEAERLGVSDVCRFVGRVARDEVERFYSIIDIAPFPRRSLPVTELVPPIKPFEAMACAKAVIVSNVAALATAVIDGVTGLVVEKNDVEALAGALRRLIEDPSLRERLGTRSRSWVAGERSVDALLPRIRAVYRSVGASPLEHGSGRADGPDEAPIATPASRMEALDAPPKWLADWIESFTHGRAGVSIKADAEQIASSLDVDAQRRLRAIVSDGDDLAALNTLISSPGFPAMSNGAKNRCRRLRATLRSAAEGVKLPKRRAPSYEPEPGRLFYVVHMRGPFESNGYVSRTRLVLKSLARAGFDPEPVTRFGFPNDLARHKTAAMDEEEPFDAWTYRGRQDLKGGQNGRPVDEYVSAYADWLVELAERRRPEAIIAASNNLNGLAAIHAARRLGVPAIYEVRGFWEITLASMDPSYATSLKFRQQRTLENQAVAEADHVLAISPRLKDFLVEQGVAPRRISVVTNGVDVEEIQPTPPNAELKRALGIEPHEVVVGYVGSIVKYEGLDLLLSALARLRAEGLTGFRFLVVGEGRELDGLKALAAELGVADVCLFVGRVSGAQAKEFYSIIDIAPFPRSPSPVTELITPLKPFEAMAAGKAVVGSSVAAISAIIRDGHTGVVAAKKDVGALAQALRSLILDAELRTRLGRGARDWVVENRSVDAMAAEFRAALDDVRRPAPGGARPRGS